MSESDYIDVLDKPFIYTVVSAIYAKKVCQDVYSPCLMVWEENSRICLRNVVSVLTGDLSSTYVRVLQYFRESIGKMADTVAVKI